MNRHDEVGLLPRNFSRNTFRAARGNMPNKKPKTKSNKPSRIAQKLATTALNHCVSYHSRSQVYELAKEMDYCLETGKSLRRVRQ